MGVLTSTLKEVELTPKQAKEWEDTACAMVWMCPGFRHLWYKLMTNHNGKYAPFFTEDEAIPIAATDGSNVVLKPSEFFTLPMPQRVFVCVHEIIHAMYDDCNQGLALQNAGEIKYQDGKVIPYSHKLHNVAGDYRINDLLVESKVGAMPTGKWAALHNPAIGRGVDSVLDIYRKIWEDGNGGNNGSQKGGSSSGQSGGGQSQGNDQGFDVLLQPGTTTGQSAHQASTQRNKAQWATEIAVAKHIETMKAQGNCPAGLLRLFDGILQPKISWTEFIRGFAARRIGSGSYDWKRPDRRLIVRDIYAPGRSGFGANWVVVLGDVSGSIGNNEMKAYLGELSGIIEDIKPKRLTAIWFEYGISQVDDYIDAQDLQRYIRGGVKGGGGTDIRPCFKWIDDQHDLPDAVVAMTDGLTPFPCTEPRYPLVWALTMDTPTPWGERVRIV